MRCASKGIGAEELSQWFYVIHLSVPHHFVLRLPSKEIGIYAWQGFSDHQPPRHLQGGGTAPGPISPTNWCGRPSSSAFLLPFEKRLSKRSFELAFCRLLRI